MALRKALRENGVPELGCSEVPLPAPVPIAEQPLVPASEQTPVLQRLSAKIAETSEQVEALKAARDEDKSCLALLSSCASMHAGMARSLADPPSSSSDLAGRVDRAVAELSRLEAKQQALESASKSKPRRAVDDADGIRMPLVSLEVPTPPKVLRAPRPETKWHRMQSELLDPQPILREHLERACRPKRAGPRVFQKPVVPAPPSSERTPHALSLGSFETCGRDPLKDHIFGLCQPWWVHH
mmetsp:Transcript_60224/g.111650  ORF Transcript_60224/g.111650 Transcript_60224/m.111650 type:complete len:241 (-) Transcript_60224:100-822(-)